MTLILSCILHAFCQGYRAITKKSAKGINTPREVWNGCGYGYHAEVAAKKNLPLNYSNNKKTLNLLVIRINKNGDLKNSKPCFKCITHLNRIPGYKINKIYYSNENGQIIESKFNDLYFEDNKYISRGFK